MSSSATFVVSLLTSSRVSMLMVSLQQVDWLPLVFSLARNIREDGFMPSEHHPQPRGKRDKRGKPPEGTCRTAILDNRPRGAYELALR